MNDLWLMVVLFIFGGILAVIELIMPGFGLPGITGIIAFIAGVVVGSSILTTGQLALIILLVFIIVIAMIVILYRSLTKGGRVSKRLFLRSRADREKGYSSNKDLKDMLGKEGIALTILRPSGLGEFDGIKLDVVTEGQFISKGTKIRVVDVEGFKVLVEETQREPNGN